MPVMNKHCERKIINSNVENKDHFSEQERRISEYFVAGVKRICLIDDMFCHMGGMLSYVLHVVIWMACCHGWHVVVWVACCMDGMLSYG